MKYKKVAALLTTYLLTASMLAQPIYACDVQGTESESICIDVALETEAADVAEETQLEDTLAEITEEQELQTSSVEADQDFQEAIGETGAENRGSEESKPVETQEGIVDSDEKSEENFDAEPGAATASEESVETPEAIDEPEPAEALEVTEEALESRDEIVESEASVEEAQAPTESEATDEGPLSEDQSELSGEDVEMTAMAASDFTVEILNGGGVSITGYNGSATNLTIPEKINGREVLAIGYSAFYNNQRLTSVTLPSTLQTIGDYAFSGSGLTSVTIPKNVTSLGYESFCCRYLKRVSFNALRPGDCQYAFQGAGSDVFEGMTVTFNTKAEWVPARLFYKSNVAKVTIPERVTSIGTSAFYGNGLINTVELPAALQTIGDYAFSGTDLASVIIPKNVTKLGYESFACSNLKKVSFNALMPDDCQYAFQGAGSNVYEGMTVTFNSKVKWIPSRLFYQSNVAKATIPGTVTSIGTGAFYGNGLIKAVILPAALQTIGDYAFSGTNLTNVNIPKNVTKLGYESFACNNLKKVTFNALMPDDCQYAFQGAGYNVYEGITVTFNNKVKWIPARIFYKSNVAQVTIPETVTSIGTSAFYGNGLIKTVTIPTSMQTIGDYAFYGTSLTSITIPKKITYLGYEAFNCNKLKAVRFNAQKADKCQYAFQGAGNKVYDGMTVTIGSDVTTLPYRTFEGANVASVKIPSSVTSIGSSAFRNCTNLTYAWIAGKNTAIGSSAFDGCSKARIFCKRGSAALAYAQANGFKNLVSPYFTKMTSKKSGISLTWKKSGGASGYFIYRDGKCVKTVSGNSTFTWIDKTVKQGKSYTYKVYAYKTINGKKVKTPGLSGKKVKYTA